MVNLNEQFMYDTKGRKKSVLIPFRKYEELMEDYHDLKLIADRKGESVSSFNDFKKELKKDGLIVSELEHIELFMMLMIRLK